MIFPSRNATLIDNLSACGCALMMIMIAIDAFLGAPSSMLVRVVSLCILMMLPRMWKIVLAPAPSDPQILKIAMMLSLGMIVGSAAAGIVTNDTLAAWMMLLSTLVMLLLSVSTFSWRRYKQKTA